MAIPAWMPKPALWIFGCIRSYWRTGILLLSPLLLLSLPVSYDYTSESKCGFIVLLMAVYWVAEVAPLPATAFLPVILLPLLDVKKEREESKRIANDILGSYLRDTNFIFVGGLIMAVALEQCNLHKRLALRVLLFMGSEPRWLMLGFMMTTAFISMWVSNTATAAMMVPIAIVVLEEIIRNEKIENAIRQHHQEASILQVSVQPKGDETKGQKHQMKKSAADVKGRKGPRRPTDEEGGDASINLLPPPPLRPFLDDTALTIPDFQLLPRHLQGICKATMLCIAYGANLGGTATLTGTGPNLIFINSLNTTSGEKAGIDYLSWLAFGTPGMILCCFLGWVWLVILFCGYKSLLGCFFQRKRTYVGVNEALRQKYDDMGKISFAEWSVMFWFVVLVLLWISREPAKSTGWHAWLHLQPGFSSDACAGMLIAVILFVFPSEKPDFCWWRHDRKKPRLRSGLVTWESMQAKFPWGVIILLGGGFSLAAAVTHSKLSDWLSYKMCNHLGAGAAPAVAALTFVTLVTFITEFASNTATASIFTPVAVAVAKKMNWHPFYLGLPTTLAASFAFMLPIATPPNAIVYETGMIELKDMAMAGFVMNLLCIAVTLLNIHTWSYALFGLGKIPDWANATNATELCTY